MFSKTIRKAASFALTTMAITGMTYAGISVSIQSRDEAVNNPNSSQPRIIIKNTGTEPISSLSYHYYFTTENNVSPVFGDYYTPYSDAVLENIGTNEYRVVYTFNNIILQPGQELPNSSGNVVGLYYSNSDPWNDQNDFSANQSGSFVDNYNIPVYANGNLIYGNEPQTAPPQSIIVFNEVCFFPESDNYQWVEITNRGNSPADVSNWKVSNATETVYTIPSATMLPPSAFIVILFDNIDPSNDDRSFTGDNKATLHATIQSIGDVSKGELTLSSYNDIISSFVAWGERSTSQHCLEAVSSGKWKAVTDYVFVYSDIEGPVKKMVPGGSIGITANETGDNSDDWAIYNPNEIVSGQNNAMPAPAVYTPQNNIKIIRDGAGESLPFKWSKVKGAEKYEVKIASDGNFNNIISIDTVTEPEFVLQNVPQDGSIFSAISAIAAGVIGNSIITTIINAIVDPNYTKTKVLNATPLAARKDTRLLDLNGSRIDADHLWDQSHLGAGHYCDEASWRCWAVGSQMINRYNGGNLTQDEIKYHVQGGTGEPEDDFAHGAAGGESPSVHIRGLMYALNITEAQCNHTNGKPTTAQVKTEIDNNRPIYFSDGGHVMVIDGYRETAAKFEIQCLNTDNDGKVEWRDFSTQNFRYYRFPIRNPGRNVDPDINLDSDNDGIMDFDETYRFPSDKNNADSDGDGIPDKTEIISYTFEAMVDADIDNDMLRTEVDFDSDNGGIGDGLEDINKNGIRDIGETNVFDGSDDAFEPLPTISTAYGVYGFNRISLGDGVTCNTSAGGYFDVAAAGIANPVYATRIGRSVNTNTVYSGTKAWLRDYSHIHGAVYARQAIDEQNNVQVDLGKFPYATIGTDKLPVSMTVNPINFTNITETAHVTSGNTLTVTPGKKYAEVRADNYSTITFTHGKYFINNLYIEWSANIVIDQSGGPVEIYVQDNMLWKVNMDVSSSPIATASKFLLAYLGTDPVYVERNFTGALVAPNASISAAQSRKTFYGMIIGRDVIVHQYANFIFVPLMR